MSYLLNNKWLVELIKKQMLNTNDELKYWSFFSKLSRRQYVSNLHWGLNDLFVNTCRFLPRSQIRTRRHTMSQASPTPQPSKRSHPSTWIKGQPASDPRNRPSISEWAVWPELPNRRPSSRQEVRSGKCLFPLSLRPTRTKLPAERR